MCMTALLSQKNEMVNLILFKKLNNSPKVILLTEETEINKPVKISRHVH